MSIFEQRQEQRLRLLLLSPAVVLFAIAAYAILTAQGPGNTPRETFFDVITGMTPRPPSGLDVALITVDEESAERMGAWPWPRSAFARLIDAAEAAGAESVNLTVSVSGEDPLSPDVIARRWMSTPGLTDLTRLEAIASLPSNDLLLARAVAGGAVGVALADELPRSSRSVRWQEAALSEAAWLHTTGTEASASARSLPSVAGGDALSAELREARVATVAGLPADRDGVVRRFAPLYAASGIPAPSSGLAAFAASGAQISAQFERSLLSSVGATPVALTVGAGGIAMPIDSRGEMRIWLPRDVSVPTVPAWRVISDPETWTRSLEGKHVFIGEEVSPMGSVSTARGELPRAQVHALIAGQLDQGRAVTRPGWAGFLEAATAILVGVAAVLAVIFLPPVIAVAAMSALAIVSFLAALFAFRGTGMLFDPSPAIFAAFGGPLAVGATVLTNMLVRDDAVRGAFHGALPQKAMRRLQAHGGSKLLHGVHRDVTVLSCTLRLPASLMKHFEAEPRDFILFTASANDRLRRTILEHQGTVDFGEDGRLLGYWNVPLDEPDHIEKACACALRMLDDVGQMSQQVAESRKVAPGADLEELTDARIEIGIATGKCFAGPVGLGGRNRYAALGPTVSFAGRLRARSELYGPAILTDGRVFEALRHHYAFLDLDFVRRDELHSPEVIYGLVGNPFLKASKTFRDLADMQRGLLEAWRTRDLATATRQLQKLRGVPGVPQPYVELFERRIMEARLSKARREDDQAEVLGP